jgi:hypothetical protein
MMHQTLTTVVEKLCGMKVVLTPSVGQQLIRYNTNFLSEMGRKHNMYMYM